MGKILTFDQRTLGFPKGCDIVLLSGPSEG